MARHLELSFLCMERTFVYTRLGSPLYLRSCSSFNLSLASPLLDFSALGLRLECLLRRRLSSSRTTQRHLNPSETFIITLTALQAEHNSTAQSSGGKNPRNSELESIGHSTAELERLERWSFNPFTLLGPIRVSWRPGGATSQPLTLHACLGSVV